MASKIQSLLTEFLEYLEIEKKRSRLTIRNYDFYLKRFIDFSKIDDPAQITMDKVREFRLALNRLISGGKKLCQATQNYHIIALRSFLKYLAKRDIKALAAEKLELAKQGERTVEFLENSDLGKILAAPFATKEPEIIKIRDKAILELFFSTGLRVSELADLNIDSINLKRDEFMVCGKNDKPRVAFLSNQSRHWLGQYLNKRHDTEPAMFLGHDRASRARNGQSEKKSHHLSPRSIQRLVQRYAKIAGLTKHVTPHTLRHSYATDLLMNGADIRSVQAMLGHSSVTTTQIYTHITNQQFRDVHKAFHGKRRAR